jgi:NADH:ubiquinone oxidoreductase subunit 6 (subunit J)
LAFETVAFYVLGALAIGMSLAVVAQRNPMHSVMLLIGSFGALSGLYVLLDSPFAAVIQIIVYAGAIMVLFLFVVMLLNVGKGTRRSGIAAIPSTGRARGVSARRWQRFSCCSSAGRCGTCRPATPWASSRWRRAG